MKGEREWERKFLFAASLLAATASEAIFATPWANCTSTFPPAAPSAMWDARLYVIENDVLGKDDLVDDDDDDDGGGGGGGGDGDGDGDGDVL